VHDFRPDPGLPKALGINPEDVVVTLRPPATYAHYHNRQSEELMAAAIRFVLRKPEVSLIFLPRTLTQKEEAVELSREYDGRIIVPPMVLDGLNVVWNSDLVISGGGTMNREAAALGVPVYSIFRGPICSVDRYLESEGRLVFITSTKDLDKIPLEKRKRTLPRSDRSFSLARFLAQKIIATAQEPSSPHPRPWGSK
jgi:predicted glycosyltransferase